MSVSACFRCPFALCEFVGNQTEQVRQHIKDHHKEDDVESKKPDFRFLCAGCGKNLTRGKFFQHLRACEVLITNSRTQPPNIVDSRPIAVHDNYPVVDDSDTVVDDIDPVVDDIDPVVDDNENGIIDVGETVPTNQLTTSARHAIVDESYSAQVTRIIDGNILGFATNNALSMKVTVEAIDICEQMNTVSVDRAQSLFERLLVKHLSDDPHKLALMMKEIQYRLIPVRQPLKLINTTYYFERYFTTMTTYVAPVYISFMKTKETERFVYPHVYNPLSNTTSAPHRFNQCGFISNPELRGAIERPSLNPPTVFKRSVDGSNCRENPLLMDRSIDVLALCLTFDDVEVASKGHKKETIFQVSIMNMAPFYSSSIEGLSLVAQGSSADFNAAYREPGESIKTTGINTLLTHLSAQIRLLETHGFTYVLNGETRRMFATLVSVVADNLATHQVFSYAAGFSCLNYPCVICNIHKSSIGVQYENFNFRDDDENELWAQKVAQAYEKSKSAGQQMTALCGQKGICELRTGYWSVPRNVTIDVMHDVDYGPLQFGIITLVRFAEKCDDLEHFTVDKLNVRLLEATFGPLDSSNMLDGFHDDIIIPSGFVLASKFNHINPALSANNSKKLKFDEDVGVLLDKDTAAATGLKAAQGYAFIKLIDYLIPPDMIPRDHLVWQHFMRLRSIVIASHSYTLTEAELEQWSYCYERLIEDIHTYTENAYPKYRPKNHYLTHLAHATRANGPPMALSTYAPERVLGYTTRQVDASGNRSNYLSLTSSKRRQFRQAVKLNNKSVLKDMYRTTKQLKAADQCSYREGIDLLKLKDTTTSNWFWTSRFTFRGSKFISGVFMCLEEPVNVELMPTIVKVHGVFLQSEHSANGWVLVQNMKVRGVVGNRCYGSFVIDEAGGSFELICLRNSYDHHPMDGYVHWATMGSNLIMPSLLRVYTNSNSRWLARINLKEPY